MIEDVKYKFEPSEELLEFADSFSKQWKSLEDSNNYFSSNDNYQINYGDILKIGEPIRSTFFIVSQNTGIIRVSKSKLQELNITDDYVFFTILWCVVEFNITNIKESDRITLEYYKKTGRSIKNIIEGYIRLFKDTNYSSNVSRIKSIMEMSKQEPKFNKNRIRILL